MKFTTYQNIFNNLNFKPSTSCEFGEVPNGTLRTIRYNPEEDWGWWGISREQFVLHELGHIWHNHLAHFQYGGWEKDGDCVKNPVLENWFLKQNFRRYSSDLPSRYDQYFKDYREWWAETFNILVHQVMDWELRETQKKFSRLCMGQVDQCPIWKVMWEIVWHTVLLLRAV